MLPLHTECVGYSREKEMTLLQPLTGAGTASLVSLKKKVVVLIAWHVMLVPNSSWIWFHLGRLRLGTWLWRKRKFKRPIYKSLKTALIPP